MELGILRCYAGLDRYAVLFKADRWLAEYRLTKIKYLKAGLFNKDHSIPLSKISEKERKTLKTISNKIGLVNFTNSRVQFLNEKKFLKQKLKSQNISYRKKRNIYSVCEEYHLNFKHEDLTLKNLNDIIWWSIATFTYEGTGQQKIASRLNRNRVVVNRKFKENPYLEIEHKFIILQKLPTTKNNIVNQIKANPYLKDRGLKLVSFTHTSGKKELHLTKQMPNEYISKETINKIIKRTNKKTFFFTKRESNKSHFKSINGNQKRVHANLAVKIPNDEVLLSTSKPIKRFSSVWNKRKKFFIKNEHGGRFLVRPTRNLISVIKTFSIQWGERELMSQT